MKQYIEKKYYGGISPDGVFGDCLTGESFYRVKKNAQNCLNRQIEAWEEINKEVKIVRRRID